MRRLPVALVTMLTANALLAGCATAPIGEVPQADAAPTRVGPPPATEPYLGSEPSPAASTMPDAVANAQADAWLDAIVLPDGAVRTDDRSVEFSSYTGWICSPLAELQGVWLIPNTGVAQTVNWIRDNPPADLVSTAFGYLSDESATTSAATGFTPADRSQQGVVLTVEQSGDGVAVRAEVAALSATSTCPTPPGGGVWGLPGQG